MHTYTHTHTHKHPSNQIAFCGPNGTDDRYGGTLVLDEGLDASDVSTVFFAVLMGALAIGQAAPGITAVTTGCGVAVAVYEVRAGDAIPRS